METEFVMFIRQFRKNKLAVIAFFIALGLVFIALFGSRLTVFNPLATNLDARLVPGFWADNFHNLLGTDGLGRDMLARLLYGAKISLKVGYTVIIITALVGIFLGIISGYYGGILDMVIMRVVDIILAFPPLLLALVIVAALGTGIEKAMLAIAIVYIPGLARIVRGSVLTVKELPYIEATLAMGGGHFWIMLRHVLPNIITPTVVYLTLLLGDAILYTAALGFLGVGIDPSIPEWGAMLSGGKDYLLLGKWWVTVFPGIMIFLAVLSFNLLGDGLREAMDAKLRV